MFNHANFNNPNGDFNGSQFGVVTSARSFGDRSGGGREGQISAKFYW
jgi:hypothetical protein